MADAQQIDSQSRKVQKIPVAAFKAKMASKREIYRFLSCEVGVYLSSYETMTVWHLRDISSNKRTRILSKDVRIQNVPNFEGLAIKDMLKYA